MKCFRTHSTFHRKHDAHHLNKTQIFMKMLHKSSFALVDQSKIFTWLHLKLNNKKKENVFIFYVFSTIHKNMLKYIS